MMDPLRILLTPVRAGPENTPRTFLLNGVYVLRVMFCPITPP